MARKPTRHPGKAHGDATAPGKTTICLRVSRRELATVLAALRFHQDENLQGRGGIPDVAIKEIATDGGRLRSLTFDEVSRLCERLNLCNTRPKKTYST